MASNTKFIDAAVGYRPQTAFPLNANEYFESYEAAQAAAANAAEVGTDAANRTSHYIGQTLTVYDKAQSKVSMYQIRPNGELKPVGDGAGEIPPEYWTYAETSAQLSNDGYATQEWVQEQGFASGGISLSDVQATIFDFGDGDLSAFGWEGEITYQNLVDAGIKSDDTIFIKQPVYVRVGNRVAGIGECAFSGCTSLSSVTIPNSVTSIGTGAFENCRGLTSVTIPNSVTSIGGGAFFCSELSSVTIPDSVTSIGWEVFADCIALKSVTIGNGVTSIGDKAFYRCSGLTEIKVEGKTQDEAKALLNGTGYPSECEIKTWDFQPKGDYVQLSSLSGFTTDTDGRNYKIDISSDGAAYVHVPWTGGGGGISLSDVQATIFDFGDGDLSAFGWTGEISQQDLIDAGIKDSIGDIVKHPVAVRIGNGVTSIGYNTFAQCRKLKSVTIPDSVTSIGEAAFFPCIKLTSITIPNSVTSIGEIAFNSSGLTSVMIPDSVTSIGNNAFSGCNELYEITVEGKTQAEAEALLANASVQTICQIKTWNFEPRCDYIIPKFEQTFTNINLAGRKLYYPAICQDETYGAGGIAWRIMFLNSKGTASKTLNVSDGSGVVISTTSVPSEPYMTIDWPDQVQDYLSVTNATADIDVLVRGYAGWYPDVKPYQFAESDVTAAGGGGNYYYAKRVGDNAFASAISLTDVDFQHASEIGYGAFQHCTYLTAVSLPRAWKIGSAAFSHCVRLSAVSLPQVFEVGSEAFSFCRSLQYADLPGVSWSADARDGNGMFTANAGLNQTQLTAVTLGDIGSFPQYIFKNCDKLQTVEFGRDSVEYIGPQAFYGCGSLVDLGYMPNVLCVNDQAFRDCTSLTAASFPNCTDLEDNVFYNCKSLVSVDLPRLSSAGKYMFSDCTSLVSVDLPALKSFGLAAFTDCNHLRHVNISSATDLSSIPANTFNDCIYLSSLVLPPLDGIKSINDRAFYRCNMLSGFGEWPAVLSVLPCAFSYSCLGKNPASHVTRSTMTFPNATVFAPSAFINSYVEEIFCSRLSSIGAHAFANSSLKRIWLDNRKKIPTVNANSFNEITATVEVYVPDDMLSVFVPTSTSTTWKTIQAAKTTNEDGTQHNKIEIIAY